jgi:hypothetical protein
MKKVRKMCVNSVLTSVLALSALWLAGCSQDEFPVDRPPVMGEKGTLSFVLPVGQNQAVTYAGEQGKTSEYELHNIRIYWFTDSDNKLFKVFGWGDGTVAGGITPESAGVDPMQLASASDKSVVTISVGTNDVPSKFFIVANVNGDTTAMIKSDPLNKVRVGVTKLDDFKAILSDALAESGGDIALLSTPIPMSISKKGTATPDGYIALEHPVTEGIVNDVHLKRRVARFDIINSSGFSNFEIKSIAVSRAQTKVWLNDSVFSDTDPYASLTGKFKVEAKAQADDADAFNGPKSTNPKVDFAPSGQYYADREHLTEAAFYLYPTQLDPQNTKTEIVLEGIYNKATPRLYSLNLPDTGDVKIQANYVYRIHVIPVDENDIDLKLEVIHWDDADTIYAENTVKLVTDWGKLSSSVDATLDVDIAGAGETNVSYEFSTSDRSPDTLRFTTRGENVLLSHKPEEQHVTHVAFLPSGTGYNKADYQAVANAKVISTTNLTYGATYETLHEVVLPPTDAPIEVIMKVMNATDTKDFKTVKLKSNNYAKTGYRPVHITGEASINNLLWAPVNVGATYLPDTKGTFSEDSIGAAIAGLHFQWGRNYPAIPLTVERPTTTTTQFASLAEALASDLWFINGDKAQIGAHWLATPDYTLWSGANAQGPCPDGWRVPTLAEVQAVTKSSNTKQGNVTAWHSFTSIADPSQVLWLPCSGLRQNNDGARKNFGNNGIVDMWVAGKGTTDGGWGARFYINASNALSYDQDPCAYGEVVRAVRDIPVAP